MMYDGIYTKLSLNDAVERSAEVLEVFIENSVQVIRIGLCSNETLLDTKYAENYHPSVGELTLNRYYLKKMTALLSAYENTAGANALFSLPNGKISQAVGQKRANVLALKEAFKLKNINFREDGSLSSFDISVTVTNS
jgi:hypothetical protein